MALSPTEKERIIEEETLRFETQNNLKMSKCRGGRCHGSGCHRCRPLFWVLAAVLVFGCFHFMNRHHGWRGCERGYGQERAWDGDGRGPGMMDGPGDRDERAPAEQKAPAAEAKKPAASVKK